MSTLKQITKRIKNIYKTEQKFTAQDVMTLTGLSRSMVSGYLNQLYKSGQLEKENTRPAYFWFADDQTIFEEIIGYDSSLSPIIEQCKAAVNYPPDGLPVIIRGNSGVGKSMLAKKIYQYAIKQQVIKPDAPFVTLNCADYANNPELLSSVLFGYVKGAFTGADTNKNGLLDAANDGYLFLDEVHNLTQENQEKLFLLIDQKKFYRLGEDNEWHPANIRIILATTEDTKTALLATFRRRIPLEVTLPDYQARTQHEKLQLVWHFFRDESELIDSQIAVYPPFLEELLHTSYEGNVGALQNKIKVSCAQAYSQQEKSSIIYVPSSNLKDYVEISSRQPDHDLLKEDKISKAFSSLNIEEICKNLQRFMLSVKSDCSTDDLGYQIILHNLERGQEELSFFGLNFSKQNLIDIALLINLLVDYRPPLTVDLNQRHLFKYLQVVHKILFLAGQRRTSPLTVLILVAYLKMNLTIKTQMQALVIMHGKNSATSIAGESNQLVGDYAFTSIDMPIQVDTQEIVHKVNEYVDHVDTKSGLILLVDMGSLEKMYTEIKDHVQGDLLILNNISTALALEVGFSLKQNHPMEYFTHLDYSRFNVESQYFEGIAQTQNIVISCMSGQGVAEKIQEIFDKFQPRSAVEILTVDYDKLKKLKALHNQATFKNTFCVIATSQITIPDVECINLEKVGPV